MKVEHLPGVPSERHPNAFFEALWTIAERLEREDRDKSRASGTVDQQQEA